MEAIILLLNCVALLVLVVSSLLNDRRKPGQPLVGPFHYGQDAPPRPAGPAGPPATRAASTSWRERTRTGA